MQIRVSVVITFLALALCSCATREAPSVGEMQSLAGNPRLPEQEIRPFFGADEWTDLRARRYDGYAVVRVQIKKDRSVTSLQIVEAFPDRSRDRLALEFASATRLFAPTVGSRMMPSGEVYVLFYESDSPHKAVVFGQHVPSASSVSFSRGDRYLKVFLY